MTRQHHERTTVTTTLACALLVALAGATSACGTNAGKSPPPPPPCDQACTDTIALDAFRDTLKLAFNKTFQGQPVGQHDLSGPCPLGGAVRVFGTATSNALQGATEVDLTYVLDHCGVPQKATDPKQTYSMTLTGTVTEKGTIAVQPSSTTSLVFASDAMTFGGTVYDPPIDYAADACPLALGQNGNQLSGTMCARAVGLTL
jgi:hypothetical protein